MDKTPTNAKALLKNIAGNTRQFGGRDELPLKKVNDISANSSIELQLANLTNLVQQVMVAPKQMCGVCSMMGHATYMCPSLMDQGGLEQANALGGFQGQQRQNYDPYSNNYNAGWRDHPHLKWNNQDNGQQSVPNNYNRPPGFFQARPQVPFQPQHQQAPIFEQPKIQKRTRKDTNEQRELQTKNLEQDEASIETEKSPKATELTKKILIRFMKSKKEQTDKEILDTFRKVQVNLPLLDAIKQVSKYAKFLKELCTNKRRFNDQEIVALSEEVSAVLQRKLPPKLKDVSSFTIPCLIGGKEFGRALCDLEASINLMPYSVYESLNLGDLKETKVVTQLADRSNRYPKGLLEDVLVQVNELIYPADFFVLEMEHDPMPTALPLILGRPFLRIARIKSDVYDGTLTMEIDGESVKFRIFNVMRYPSDFESCLSIDAFDYFVQDCFNKGVGQDNLEKALVHNITYGNLNYSEHIEEELIQTVATLESLSPIRGEDETLPIIISSQHIAKEREKLIREGAKPIREAQRRLNPLMMEVVKKEVIKLLDVGIIYPISDSKWVSPIQVVPKQSEVTVLKNEANELMPTHVQNSWRVCTDYQKINNTTRKNHVPVPFIHQMLERLAGHSHYCFLDGYSGYNQIAVAPEDQENMTFTCPFGTFAYQRMPFGLCNAPATFQRCMVSIFSSRIEKIIEVFMDDFSVYGDSFYTCLHNLSLVLKCCQDTNQVLNWEKCHFMVSHGLVLGHIIFENGIEVDKSKVELVSSLPLPTTVREVRSFLGHAGFYRRFMKDFSMISRPLCHLLQNDVTFGMNEECVVAFNMLKELLSTAPVIMAPDWSFPFEVMCDASDYAVGAVLGQCVNKVPHVIYYAYRTLNDA
ncbi:unnamed protein product [Malus baccata var. baccata]